MMASSTIHQNQIGYLLGNNSIVNINGVRARLAVDGSTGSIQVIPVGEEDCLQEEHKYKKERIVPSVNRSNDMPPSTDNELLLPVPDQAGRLVVSALGNDPKDIRESLDHQDVHNVTSGCSASIENCFGKSQEDILDERTRSNNINAPVSKIGSAEVDLEPKSTVHKLPQGIVDANSVRIDQHLDRDVLEQDLLEQFLSSVTHDFQFSNSVPTESPNANIEPNLFLSSVKTDSNLIGPDPIKGLPVSSYAFLTDTELKSVEQTFRNVSTSQPEVPICNSDVDKPPSFTDWSFQTDKVPSSLDNVLTKGKFPKESLRKFEKATAVNTIPKRRGRQPKVVNSGPAPKLKPLRPKPTSQNILIINVPPTSLRPPYVKCQTQKRTLFVSKRHAVKHASTKEKTVSSHTQNDNVLSETRLSSNLDTSDISSSQNQTVQSNDLIPNKIMTTDKISVSVSQVLSYKIEQTESIHNCPACPMKVATSELQSHLLTHPNICAVCEMVFVREADLFEHLSEHDIDVVRDDDGSTELKCRICLAQFLHAGNVQRHVMTNCESKQDDTSLVMKSGNGSVSGKVSATKKKTQAKKLVCHKCGRLLSSKSLPIHLSSHCPADDPDRQTNPVQCNVCKNLFRNLMTFKRHFPLCRGRLNSNDGDDSVTCDSCFKSVSVNSLKTHKRLYCSAAKPETQTCRFCGTLLKHKHSLRNHVKWHCKKSPCATNPMKCTCGKVFRNYKAFQSHYQNHCLVKLPAHP